MNTLMYEHPLTGEHLRVVKEVIGYHVFGPMGKALACGDVGKGSFLPTKDVAKHPQRSWCNDGVDRYRTDRSRPLQPTKVYG